MRILTGVIAGLLCLAVSTQGWTAEVIRLGFFDKQAIVDRSELGKEGEQKFNAEMEKVREKLKAELVEIQNLQDEFNKKKLVWSEEVKKAKLQEIYGRKQKLAENEQRAKLELGRLEQQLLEPLKLKLLDIVNRIGKEEGYTMIFEREEAGLFYAPNSLNLTDRIIRELNENYASEKARQ